MDNLEIIKLFSDFKIEIIKELSDLKLDYQGKFYTVEKELNGVNARLDNMVVLLNNNTSETKNINERVVKLETKGIQDETQDKIKSSIWSWVRSNISLKDIIAVIVFLVGLYAVWKSGQPIPNVKP